MTQPGAYVRRLTFKQTRGLPGRERRRDMKSIWVICHRRLAGSISPNSASISRARSPVAEAATCGREYLLRCLIVASGKASSGREFFTAPDVLSPMEFLSFSTSFSVPPSLSLLSLFHSSYLLYFPRLGLFSSAILRNGQHADTRYTVR